MTFPHVGWKQLVYLLTNACVTLRDTNCLLLRGFVDIDPHLRRHSTEMSRFLVSGAPPVVLSNITAASYHTIYVVPFSVINSYLHYLWHSKHTPNNVFVEAEADSGPVGALSSLCTYVLPACICPRRFALPCSRFYLSVTWPLWPLFCSDSLGVIFTSGQEG